MNILNKLIKKQMKHEVRHATQQLSQAFQIRNNLITFIDLADLILQQIKQKHPSIHAYRHIKIKSLKSILSIKIFLIENKCKTPYGCLTFIFNQKCFFMIKWA